MTIPPGTGTADAEAGTGTTSMAGAGHATVAAGLSVLAWTSFLMPLAVSLAANFTWGVGTGSVVLIVAGLVSPLLLVLAIERWRALPGLTGAARGVQIVGMGIVAAIAAGWSWVHTTDLLLTAVRAAAHLPADAALGRLPWLVVLLCIVAPLAVDGLAVLSVLTLAATPTDTGTTGGSAGCGHSDENADGGWGPADTVPGTPDLPSDGAERPAARARRLSSVPGQRTKRELERAARELGVPRKAKESVEQFRARVEIAERARVQTATSSSAHEGGATA